MTRDPVAGGNAVKYTLALAPVFQFMAFLQGTATPIKSFYFHTLSTIGAVCLYLALMLAGNSDDTVAMAVQDAILSKEPYQRQWPYVLATIAVAVFTVFKTFPLLYQSFRSEISYVVWSLMYFVLVGNPTPPAPPQPLSQVYKVGAPKQVTMQPYSESHPYQVAANMAVPAIAGGLPETAAVNAGSLVQLVTKLFGVIAKLDRFFPQANVDTPLEYKVRLGVTEDGQERYPSNLFSLPILNFPAMGKTLQYAPQPAVDSFKDGQYLAYLAQYGIGNTFLKRAKETTTYPFFELVTSDSNHHGKHGHENDTPGLVIDFRHLEEYEEKEDYEPYGGIAYFVVNKNKNLELKWVVAPRTEYKTAVQKKAAVFRRAEAMIVSSLYFSVVAGKHLAEIHMT